MASLSNSDLSILAQAATDRNTSVFRDMMDRRDGSGDSLKDFFEGHAISSCENDPPHTHMKSFIGMLNAACEGEGERLREVLDFFETTRGSLKERHDATLEKFQVMELPRGIPEPIAALLSLLLGGGKSVAPANSGTHQGVGIGFGPRGREDQYIVRVSGSEVVVQGDYQPPEDMLIAALTDRVPGFSKETFRIRRVKSDGSPVDPPMMAGMNFDDEEKIEVPADTLVAESFSDMMARIKSMKAN